MYYWWRFLCLGLGFKPIDDWGCSTGEGSLCLGLGFKPIDDWGCTTGEGSLCLGLGFKPGEGSLWIDDWGSTGEGYCV